LRFTFKKVPSALSFKWRIFIALVAISAVVSLAIGLVLYYFTTSRIIQQEEESLSRRSSTANAGAEVFLEGLRNPEDKTFPQAESYAEALVRSVDDTGLGTLYVGPGGEPLAARNGLGESVPPEESYKRLGINKSMISRVRNISGEQGLLIPRSGSPHYLALWPLTGPEGDFRGIMAYYSPESGLQSTLSSLRLGIIGAIGTSILLAGGASFVLSRQITRPLSETRDAALRLASGEYTSVPAADRRDELGELGQAFNYMSAEIEHYINEMRNQKSRLEAVLDASPEAVIQTDSRERVVMVNPAASAVLGIRPESTGHGLEELGIPEEILHCLREAAVNDIAVREVELEDRSLWTYAARMKRGDSGGIILAVRDITEHRALERSKTVFLSDVSHELRNPLTTIQSAVSILESTGERLEAHERRAIELAEQELARVRSMVEELLTLAQMDSSRYSLELGPASVVTVVTEAVESVEPKAQRYGIEIHFQESGEYPCTCDSQRLYQVFLNLLDNAVKYSEAGSRVEVSIEEDEENTTVHVRDTGMGIPEEDLPQLFERFYRVDKDRSRATGGTGLGLAIAKEIVEMHGGEIEVESRVGEGSTFSVKLPKAPLPRSANYAI
jgi:PAS domain S-box-containing protein